VGPRLISARPGVWAAGRARLRAPTGKHAGSGAEVLVERVSRTYPGPVRALVDVDLRVAPGEFVLLAGPSGSGKSTLLNLIGALDRADAGRILVDDRELDAISDLAVFRRQTVGFVFQLHHLLPMLSAQMNVEVPLIGAGIAQRSRQALARRMLDEVGLQRSPEAMPSELSGGERQLVAVARALVNHPPLLLADEPTGSLDPRSRDRVLDLLKALRDRHGMTVVMVSHDERDAAVADRVVRLRDGRVAPAS
jgi:putative ABC transport system ATP-binding protein